MKVATAGVTTQNTAQKQNELEERMASFATLGLELFPLTTEQNLHRFCYYLGETLKIELKGKQAGSLILTVHCRTLEILERLW